jgi:3-hydroxyacyl-CoA dehydrogenase/enoyl-CoA hydratase/3-hydroxybutyryl-CoA epimerase/enoyl-CoA isomerase
MSAELPKFQGQSLQLRALESGLVELCFDRAGESINKFDVRTIHELSEATAVLYALPGLRGVLVTSGKTGFIVGADIFEFTALFARPAADIAVHIATQNTAFRRFEDLPVPTVTAINGIALGGGLEQALASDYRVIAQGAEVGLPEVNLGLFPGYGGTVRLPRLTCAAVAIDWISSGKARTAEQALTDGVVDAIASPQELHRIALSMLREAIDSGAWRQSRLRRRGPFAADRSVFEQAKARLTKPAAWQPAALAAVTLMESCSPLERDAALECERSEFARIAHTQAAASLVQLFISQQELKSKSRAFARQARQVRSIGVLGAGIMGGGIAFSAATHGVRAIMKDIATPPLDRGAAEARRLLDKQVQSGRLTAAKAEGVHASIRAQLDYQGFENLDLVIEAVVERESTKQHVLRELEPRIRADAVIASNTSSLSIARMAQALIRPENFVGMHFFNPVPVMPLVEIIRGPQTGAEAAATAASLASSMGKTPIVVKDCPGFLVNRILTAYLVGYFRALRDGADFVEVDRVMESFGWPMGPAYLQDVVGLDTLLHVVETITDGYPDRMRLDFPYPPQRLVGQQRLGQKNGKGYYRYHADSTGKLRKVADPEGADIVASVRVGPPRPFNDQTIVERLMLPMITEAARCLEQGIADSAAEIDVAVVLGLGFPRHAGGPLKYADWQSLPQVVASCSRHAELGSLYEPTQGMREMARHKGRFLS